jgi:hypothetical protein
VISVARDATHFCTSMGKVQGKIGIFRGRYQRYGGIDTGTNSQFTLSHVKVRGKTIELNIDFPIVVQKMESSDIFHKHHGIESPLH